MPSDWYYNRVNNTYPTSQNGYVPHQQSQENAFGRDGSLQPQCAQNDTIANQSPGRGYYPGFVLQGTWVPAAPGTDFSLPPAAPSYQRYPHHGEQYAYPPFYLPHQRYQPPPHYLPEQRGLTQQYGAGLTVPPSPPSDDEDGGVSIAPAGNLPGVDAEMEKVRQRSGEWTTEEFLTDAFLGPQAMSKLVISLSPKKEGKFPHQHLLPRPKPTDEYMRRANAPSTTLSTPRSLLVVLDLNGTLVHRSKSSRTTFTSRPMVNEFLQYLLANHTVMIWSSAQRKNVESMCSQLMTADAHAKLVAIWAREELRLPPRLYNQKVQVYKQLSWIWEDLEIQASHPDRRRDVWSQANTVLIDDSAEKAASEPHSIVQLEEFTGAKEQRQTDVLGQVVRYLERLKWESDVSACMREKPFVYSPGEAFDWVL